jgi:TRAP-type C4-dicarboxylate transport system substrate-binding protein
MHLTRRLSRTGIVALLAATTAACGSGAPSKAGGQQPALKLVAVAPSPKGFPGGDQLAEFADQVSKLSNGTITIELSPAMNVSEKDNDVVAISMVRNGKVAIGVIPARGFDLVGVSSLRALQAPFLVSTSAVGDKLLADPIADEMLSGLSTAGLTGLALTYDSLRHPIGFRHPLVSPADFEGATIAAPQSTTTKRLLEALGATATDVNGDALEGGIVDGTIRGLENSMEFPTAPEQGIVTGNAPLFLKANAIVIDSKAFAGLTTAQQSVLRRAAVATRDWASTRHLDASSAAAKFCSDAHGDVTLATPEQLAALHSAAEPVLSELDKDPLTARAIARIRLLATSTSTSTITPCTSSRPPRTDPSSTTAGSSTPASPNGLAAAVQGVWRVTVALDPNGSKVTTARDAALNNGVWTWTFRDGTFDYLEPRGRRAKGTWTLTGNTLTMTETDGTLWKLGIALHDGTISVKGLTGGTDAPELLDLFFAGGLSRVGSAP